MARSQCTTIEWARSSCQDSKQRSQEEISVLALTKSEIELLAHGWSRREKVNNHGRHQYKYSAERPGTPVPLDLAWPGVYRQRPRRITSNYAFSLSKPQDAFGAILMPMMGEQALGHRLPFQPRSTNRLVVSLLTWH
jgi:hypothetical protein